MSRPLVACSLLLFTALLAACGGEHAVATPRLAAALAAQAKAPYARAVAPKDVPADVVQTALPVAQADADAASKRRGIDTFTLPANPLGLQIGSGADSAWALSFLGTAQHDADLNIELRALVAGKNVGTSLNYSGETTQGRRLLALPALGDTDATPSFELLTGLPGDGVTDGYGDYLSHLGQQLVDRYQAKPFQFDDTPLVFAIHQRGDVTGYLFMNQGNQLVVGDSKYADIQSVACVTADGDVAASYTIVGFNRKTSKPGAAPAFKLENDARFGLIARCGQI